MMPGETHWPDELKQQAIQQVVAGNTIVATSNQLGIPEETVRHWYRDHCSKNPPELPQGEEIANMADRAIQLLNKTLWSLEVDQQQNEKAGRRKTQGLDPKKLKEFGEALRVFLALQSMRPKKPEEAAHPLAQLNGRDTTP